MWARIYSEDVLHRPFEPISDFLVVEKIAGARQSNDSWSYYGLLAGAWIRASSEWLSSDKGFGGGGRSARDILMPGGVPVGQVTRSNRRILTVDSAKMQEIIDDLTGNAVSVTKPRYRGTWFSHPEGQFGVRMSEDLGLTIDLRFEWFPFKRIHLP